MFSFLERFLRGSSLNETAPISNAYFLLGPSEQEVVRNYFGAATDVCRLLDSLRRHEQNVAHEAVLARFERAEKLYSGIGFLPILPSSTRGPGQFSNRQSPQFEADRLPERGFLVRRESGRLPFFYASALKKHAARLRTVKPRQFASSSRVAVLSTEGAGNRQDGYQAWTPEG